MHSFTMDELQEFYRILDSVVSEVAERELPLCVYVMIARLFTAAERGERNPRYLRQAILGENADGENCFLPSRRFGADIREVKDAFTAQAA